MHRTTAARSARLLRQHRLLSSQNPNICPFCLHRSLHTSRPLQEDVSDAERKRREGLSAAQKTALARDKALDKIRSKLWKGTPPGADDPYTGENRPRPSEAETRPRADEEAEEMLTLGGEESAEIDEDVRAYERRTAQEERERYQQLVDEAPEHREYVPVTRWEGLEVVGGETQWNSGAGVSKNKTFKGFLPTHRMTSPTLLSLAVHRAAVEVWYAHSVGIDPMALKEAGPLDVKNLEGVAHKVGIRESKDGNGVIIGFPSEDVQAALREQIDREILREEEAESEVVATDDEAVSVAEEQSIAEEEEAILTPSLKEYRKVIRSLGPWTHVPIKHPEIKLAFARRVTQLTGHVIPSILLTQANLVHSSWKHLLESVETQTTTYEMLVGKQYASEHPLKTTKPRLLDELIENPLEESPVGPLPSENFGAKSLLGGLRNVTITGRRHTPIDKEKEVGRWKVIEKTLREKGLPVTGPGGIGGLQHLRPAHRP